MSIILEEDDFYHLAFIPGEIEDTVCDPLIGYKWDETQKNLTWTGNVDQKVKTK